MVNFMFYFILKDYSIPKNLNYQNRSFYILNGYFLFNKKYRNFTYFENFKPNNTFFEKLMYISIHIENTDVNICIVYYTFLVNRIPVSMSYVYSYRDR